MQVIISTQPNRYSFWCGEPTDSLDYESRQNIISLLKKLQADGKTILIVSHDPEVIEVAETHHDLMEIMKS